MAPWSARRMEPGPWWASCPGAVAPVPHQLLLCTPVLLHSSPGCKRSWPPTEPRAPAIPTLRVPNKSICLHMSPCVAWATWGCSGPRHPPRGGVPAPFPGRQHPSKPPLRKLSLCISSSLLRTPSWSRTQGLIAGASLAHGAFWKAGVSARLCSPQRWALGRQGGTVEMVFLSSLVLHLHISARPVYHDDSCTLCHRWAWSRHLLPTKHWV